ncbi:MAG: thioredoxin-dependent thiol peroxidase [Thermoleophilia bacterium]|nr:thioredoxin-dependent thiol peroxidase [Thermoleophilia bacterium]
MARLTTGSTAPDFTLPSDGGGDITLSSLRGAPVVIIFYPKAMTSGCTTQACEFRDALTAFSAMSTRVLAISPDPVSRLVSFRAKEGLTFPLLSDESHEVLEAYGVWVQKSMYGRTYMGVERSTFVVDADGVIQQADYRVTPTGDAARVLALLI